MKELLDIIEELRRDFAALKEENAVLRVRIIELNKELEKFKRGKVVPSSERQRRPRPTSTPKTPAEREESERRRKAKREANTAEQRELLPEVFQDVPASDTCPTCGKADEVQQLPPHLSTIVELIPARLVRQTTRRSRCVCRRCTEFWEAPAPVRALGTSQYGPNLIAELVVSKCEDSLPLNRVSTRLGRAGFHLARQTATDLFHAAAIELRPIYESLLKQVEHAPHVHADETSQPRRAPRACKRDFIWTFITPELVTYVYANSRSGSVAAEVLGDSSGSLTCDGHTGYNEVTDPEKRRRHGCLSHARSKFVLALASDPERAQHAITLFNKAFEAERLAKQRGVLGTPQHQELRDTLARPALERLKAWVALEQPKVLPKSQIADALRYTHRQWERLQAYLPHLHIAPDNNLAERMLRVVARGRDSFRWVGTPQAGENLCVLLTLVQTCRHLGVEPTLWIAQTLIRVGHTPKSQIHSLLPGATRDTKPPDFAVVPAVVCS